mmetsp:Transcript_28300/g.91622  ORF Transcript_28300/g.91622 Transcript_28300/m.91622 type:complete len:207 (-) Transcript_28300:1749-2369(-)
MGCARSTAWPGPQRLQRPRCFHPAAAAGGDPYRRLASGRPTETASALPLRPLCSPSRPSARPNRRPRHPTTRLRLSPHSPPAAIHLRSKGQHGHALPVPDREPCPLHGDGSAKRPPGRHQRGQRLSRMAATAPARCLAAASTFPASSEHPPEHVPVKGSAHSWLRLRRSAPRHGHSTGASPSSVGTDLRMRRCASMSPPRWLTSPP